MTGIRLVSLCALLALGGCSTPAPTTTSGSSSKKAHSVLPPADASSVGVKLATVGDAPIGSTLFDLEASRVTPEDGQKLSNTEKRKVLDDLVTEEILFQEASKEGLYLDPKVKKIMVNLLLRKMYTRR